MRAMGPGLVVIFVLAFGGTGCGVDPVVVDPGATDDAGDPGAPGGVTDMAVKPGTSRDMAHTVDLAVPRGADLAMNMGGTPMGGTIGAKGGSVDRLYFAFHGDTRPMSCNDSANYPTAVIREIFQREGQQNAQFSLDLGDHFFVCGTSNYAWTAAEAQMHAYMSAANLIKIPNFMTMGNHECAASGNCAPGSGDPNSTTYLKYLAPISKLPYYSFNIMTKSGLATFVIVADNAWDNAQQAWLQSTLGTADAQARYIIVARHHPIDNTDGNSQAIWQIIQAHRYSLFLAGHTHEYKHDTYLDRSGRALRIGNGGAPLDNGFTWNGYGLVKQGLDDRLYVTVYDSSNNMPMDSFNVAP